jgi:hypothetical protein
MDLESRTSGRILGRHASKTDAADCECENERDGLHLVSNVKDLRRQVAARRAHQQPA